jgi:hypothetical protein
MRWATYNRLIDRLVAADAVTDEGSRRPGREEILAAGAERAEITVEQVLRGGGQAEELRSAKQP